MLASVFGAYFCISARNYDLSINWFLGQLGGPSFVESVPGSSNVLFAKLQSKIGTSLPSSRVKELGSLFSAYKVNYASFLGEEGVCFCLNLSIIW